jgi:hypothetical protein
MWGGGVQSFEVMNSNDEKNIYKIHHCLWTAADRQWLTHNNQKQASATEESIKRMCAGREARGKVQYHCFGGNRVGR